MTWKPRSASEHAVDWMRSADLRYKGQSWDIEVDFPDGATDRDAVAALVERFEHEHERVYGVVPEERLAGGDPRAAARGPRPRARRQRASGGGGRLVGRGRVVRRADFGPAHGMVETSVARARRGSGARGSRGRLLIDEYDTTIVVPPGWHVALDTAMAPSS